MNYFVTAIGTDSGKTLASAILTEALEADYWKPIQAGFPTDSNTIRKLISPQRTIHPEKYLLQTPASPHIAAEIDGVQITIPDFSLPKTPNHLIIEGAGGLMVPLNDKDLIIDLIPHFQAKIVLVCNIYLGSINHTLLSLELIKQRGYSLQGIIFNGPKTQSTETIILKYSGATCLLHIEKEPIVTVETIKKYAERLKANWKKLDR